MSLRDLAQVLDMDLRFSRELHLRDLIDFITIDVRLSREIHLAHDFSVLARLFLEVNLWLQGVLKICKITVGVFILPLSPDDVPEI